jgi:lipocalin
MTSSIIAAESRSNYWILDTDYENYSVVYFCFDRDGLREALWVLSRSKTLSPKVKDKVEALVDANFDRNSKVFVKTAHTDCRDT